MDTWMEQYFGRPEKHLAELLPLLEAQGASLLRADYSGGNDEGGVEDITLYAGLVKVDEGHPKAEREIAYEGGYQDRIWELCDAILSTQYGSWAGDWSASGALYVDVAAKHCWKSGQIQDWMPDDVALDVTLGA